MKITIRPDGSIEIEGSASEAAEAARKLRNGDGPHAESVVESRPSRQARLPRKTRPVKRSLSPDKAKKQAERQRREGQALKALIMINDAASVGVPSSDFMKPLGLLHQREIGSVINVLKGLIRQAALEVENVFVHTFQKKPRRLTTYFPGKDIDLAIEEIKAIQARGKAEGSLL